MIIKEHSDLTSQSSAIFSDCGKYRYCLTREWDGALKRVAFVMLNPSTADEVKNDPTVERCERRARTLGFGAFRVCNIFAWRDTDPKLMKAALDPIGPANDAAILEACAWADVVVCAWGAHGDHMNRGAECETMMRTTGASLYHVGLTKAGLPRHPLYVAYAVKPTEWIKP